MFEEKYRSFLEEFGKGRKMVLSTAADGIVSSRMMSVVQSGGVFYFQTDRTMRKYRQICENRNVALCIDNIQIEGIAKEEGTPSECKLFSELFGECFEGSYDAYSSLENERVFGVEPVFVQRWVYADGAPYVEIFFVTEKHYTIEKYVGV